MSTARSRAGLKAGVSALQPRTSGLEFSALWTLFTLSLRQFLRGRRVIVLALLALLPAGLALLVRSMESRHGPSNHEIAFVFLFTLVPHVLLPLTALLYGTGMILDEQEEQTLTYLLIRPLPKWALYVTKLLAVVCMMALLAAVFVVVTYAATYLGSGQFFDVFPGQMLKTFALMTLAMATYAALFGCLSVLVQRALIVGIVYIAVIEGLLANLDFAVRKLTVNYYFRVLALNWLNLDRDLAKPWNIHLSTDPKPPPGAAELLVNLAPEPLVCVLVLLGIIVATTFLAVRVFSTREFYVKTPEAN